jgi:CheY-like chemotaxis protein
MSEMNGIELATMTRKINKDIPIILMSSSDITDIDHSFLKFSNIEDIITKPIKLKDFRKNNTVKQKIIVKH